MSEILHIENHNEFKTYINSGRSILVDFYAEWCGPCKLLAPRLEELRFKYPNVLIIKVDVDKAEEICNEYSITSMPTVIGFNNRNIIETVFGFNDTKITELMEKLESTFYLLFLIDINLKFIQVYFQTSMNKVKDLIPLLNTLLLMTFK